MSTIGPVLVIDDDHAFRIAITDALGAEGYEVWTAQNGHDALQLLRSLGNPPQVILLDLSMPEMGGLEFRRHQLAQPQLAQIPTYLFSAAGNLVETTRELPLTGVLRKPITLVELLQVLQRHCA